MSDEINDKLTDAFKAVFGKRVVFANDLEQSSVKAWDSLQHVRLMIEIERRFGVRLDGALVSTLVSVEKIRATLLAKAG